MRAETTGAGNCLVTIGGRFNCVFSPDEARSAVEVLTGGDAARGERREHGEVVLEWTGGDPFPMALTGPSRWTALVQLMRGEAADLRTALIGWLADHEYDSDVCLLCETPGCRTECITGLGVPLGIFPPVAPDVLKTLRYVAESADTPDEAVCALEAIRTILSLYEGQR